ncbi:hypothetical protein N206_06250 [Helicobacter pylori UM111]|nr:hypothetical protein N206_06250 [Helicobacter pylori UM111]
MKLYNKTQELINESESLKQKNNEVLGLAKNELSDLINTKAKENLESLKNEFQGYLNGKLIEMPIIVKKNVKELVNKQATRLESLKVQLLQNALMLEADIINNKMKIENEFAYNLERKELIKDGKLRIRSV